MPRHAKMRRSGSAFQQIQRQARGLLSGLRRDIRAREVALRRLKDEETRLIALTGRPAGVGARSVGRGRINWKTVLSQVPRQFKASDIRRVRGLKDKRPSEIFAAITRWIDAGMVKRKARGHYART